MKTHWLAQLPAAVLLAVTLSAPAATFRVDDSRTVVGQALTSMKWRQFVPGRGADHSVEGQLPVTLHLNLAPWLNRPARLYIALAPTADTPVRARWQTQGRLLAGTLQSGARALVFEGVISQAVLQETILLTLTADGRHLTSSQSLQFYFEIDVAS